MFGTDRTRECSHLLVRGSVLLGTPLGLNSMARSLVPTDLIRQYMELEVSAMSECYTLDVRSRLALSICCARFLCRHERINILLNYFTGQRRFNILQLSTEIEGLRRCEWDPDTYEFDIVWKERAQDGIKAATQKIQVLLDRYLDILPPQETQTSTSSVPDSADIDAVLIRSAVGEHKEALAAGLETAAKQHKDWTRTT